MQKGESRELRHLSNGRRIKTAVGKCTCEWQVAVCHEHMLSAAACGFRPVTLWSQTEMTAEEAAAIAVQLRRESA